MHDGHEGVYQRPTKASTRGYVHVRARRLAETQRPASVFSVSLLACPEDLHLPERNARLVVMHLQNGVCQQFDEYFLLAVWENAETNV